MATPKSNLTAEQLKHKFSYDPETGIFTKIRSIHGNPCSIEKTTPNVHGYIVFAIGKTRYLAHRLAWLYVYGEHPLQNIDHINGVKTDNRIANLRDVSQQINVQNQHLGSRSNRSGFAGIKKSLQKWSARIQVGSQSTHLGNFPTQELAHAAYVEAKRKLHAGFTGLHV